MRILFQGDSITDCSRNRENLYDLGKGYALMVKGQLGLAYPGAHEYINKGISGNRIVDLYARIKCDLINLKPDLMSILIGVNDVWHECSCQNGIDADKFFKIYSMLIEEVKAAVPDIKIMILEPFCLKEAGNEAYYDVFRLEVEKRAAMARKLAQTYGLTFVELQAGLDELATKMPINDILGDGVHPTSIGHTYIKNEWIKAFEEMTK